MPIKDVYGKEANRDTHLRYSYNPLTEYSRDREYYKKETNMIERDRNNLEYMPDQKWHQIASFVKSGVRIAGYILLLVNLPIAVGVLTLSEIIGIVEELV